MRTHITRWQSLTLSPADRAILDHMEEEMSKWQPIETAPTDPNVTVLLWDGQFIYLAAKSRYHRDMWDDGDFNSRLTGFTHWMPLPEPPNEP